MTPRALATDRSLAGFHEARSALYEAFGELLGRGLFGGSVARGLAFAGDDALVARLQAAMPDALQRERESAGIATRVDELHALAELARLTVTALRKGDLDAAARVSEVQGHYLREHAAPSLAAYAADLEASGAPLHAAVGRALARVIARDVALNGAPDGRAPLPQGNEDEVRTC